PNFLGAGLFGGGFLRRLLRRLLRGVLCWWLLLRCGWIGLRCGWIGRGRGGLARLVLSILLVCHGAAPSQFFAGYPSCQRPIDRPIRSQRAPRQTSKPPPSGRVRLKTACVTTQPQLGGRGRRAARQC